jgi:hypothetical protein
MALLDSFYGDTPSYLGGLLGEDELRRLQGQAQSQSNLGMATALLRAGAPSRTPGGGALAIAEGLQMGQDTYRKALNQGLQEKMQGLQVNELIRKQQEAEQVRRFLPQLMQPGAMQLNFSGDPQQISDYFATPGQGVLPMQQGPSTINRDALQRLALAAPDQFSRIAPSLKAMQPEYKEAGGMLYELPAYGGVPTVVGGKAKDESPSAIKEYKFAQDQGYKGTFQEFELEKKRAGASNMTLKMPSETQLIAAGFADRMSSAQNIVSDLEPKAKIGTGEAITSYLPLIGKTIPQVIPSSIGGLSDERRQYLQAANNWIRANLRKESGAAIGMDEWSEEYKNYFPQVGDDKDTIAQKAVFREIATKNMARAAGQQYTPNLPKSASKETKDIYEKYGLTPR